MKTKLIVLALFATTGTAVAIYPALHSAVAPIAQIQIQDPVVVPTSQKRIEVVFVLDTTGSMSGLIQAAKEKIWSIASSLAQAQDKPEIRMGLVAYRDRGDDYVTKVVDLNADLDAMYATLMDFQAGGGGDGPESVNQALSDAVNRISWSADQNTYRVVFLVGDAPPHMDYNEVRYPETVALAASRGIRVNAVQCGSDGDTTNRWKQIAQVGKGEYFQVDQAGSAVAIASPFDDRMAKLSRELDGTRLYYGSGEDKAKAVAKEAAGDKFAAGASAASQARRAAFNATESGKKNKLGDKELVDEVASGRLDIDSLPAEALPAALAPLAPEVRKAEVKAIAEKRERIEGEIADLAKHRQAYLEEQVAAKGDAKDSLDAKVLGAVRAQAADSGITYRDEDKPAY
jgi:Mg-chelatase subunit ChlD